VTLLGTIRSAAAVPIRGRLGVLALTLAGLAPFSPAGAGPRHPDRSAYLGGGVQYGWIASEHPSIDGSEGSGYQVVGGVRVADRLFFDMRIGGIFVDVGPAPEIIYPADRADYTMLAMGLLYEFRKPGAKGPSFWVALHGSYHNVNWKSFVYVVEGLGVSPSAGVQIRTRWPLMLRLGVMPSFYSSSSNYDAPANGSSLLIALDCLLRFGDR
jgi:hypothetical protein